MRKILVIGIETSVLISICFLLPACSANILGKPGISPAAPSIPTPISTQKSSPVSSPGSTTSSIAPSYNPPSASTIPANSPQKTTAHNENNLENKTSGSTSASIKKEDAQVYMDFLNVEQNEELVFFSKEDIDLDGNEEVILAVGSLGKSKTSSDITRIIVLRDRNGKIEQLDSSVESGYGISEVKLIRLKNLPKKYIYSRLTNGGPLSGFRIDEILENQVKPVVYSASPTGSGDDEIQDFDHDGQIDGFVQNRSSYDVLYYPLQRSFVLKDGKFVLSSTTVAVPKYPDNIKEVLLQYLSLRVLNIEKSPEVDRRIAELCIYNKESEIEIAYDPWAHTLMGIGNQMNFTIEQKNDAAYATVSIPDKNKQYKLTFHLINKDEKWLIDEIK
jgi:hypothetical protein